MKYTVNVKEISCGFVEVNADSEDEAREIADVKYHEGNIIWESVAFSTQEVTEHGKELNHES